MQLYNHDKPSSYLTIVIECCVIFFIAKLMLLYEYYIVVNNGLGFIDSVMRGDSWWFHYTIQNGYMASPLTNDPIRMGQANWAFFPLYPIICTAIHFISNLEIRLIEIWVNQLELFLCLITSYKLALQTLPKQSAIFLPLAIATSPANIWFIAAYSDMTFLLLSVIAFDRLSNKQYWQFAIVGFLLSLSRFVGVLIIIPLLINFMRNNQRQPIKSLIIQIIIIMSGLLSFMLYLYFKTGDALAFYHIQSAWGHLNTQWINSPIDTFIKTWRTGVSHDRVFLIIAPASLMLLIIEKKYEEFSFAFLCIIAPIAAGSLWSFSRYLLGLYPFYLSIALIHRRNNLVGIAILIILAFISADYCNTWLNGNWV